MSSPVNLDIEVAIAKEMKAKPTPSKPLQMSKNDLRELERQIEQRKKDILFRRQEERLKAPQVRARIRQQQRIKAKEDIFAKYTPVIKTELEVLQMEIIDLNECYKVRNDYFTIKAFDRREIKYSLVEFEHRLRHLRQSTCFFKYGHQGSTCSSVLFWVGCWYIMPILCCCRGGLFESKAHVKLRETYEKYERMMVQQNESVALPME